MNHKFVFICILLTSFSLTVLSQLENRFNNLPVANETTLEPDPIAEPDFTSEPTKEIDTTSDVTEKSRKKFQMDIMGVMFGFIAGLIVNCIIIYFVHRVLVIKPALEKEVEQGIEMQPNPSSSLVSFL